MITFEDITERKEATEALRRSELRNRTLLEGSPVCSKIIDVDSNLQYMSLAGREQLKISEIEYYYGKRYPFEFYHESVRAPQVECLNQAIAGQRSSLEGPVNDTEGNEVWYHTTFVPCFDDDGRVEHVVATSVNITDRKQMQMQSTQDRYRMLVDLASDSIVLVDPETCGFVEFNRNAHERLGYTRIKFENITMSDIEAIEAIETEDDVAAHIAAVVHRGNDEFQTKHRSSVGKVHDVHVKPATISIGGKTLLLSTWNDINVNDNGD